MDLQENKKILLKSATKLRLQWQDAFYKNYLPKGFLPDIKHCCFFHLFVGQLSLLSLLWFMSAPECESLGGNSQHMLTQKNNLPYLENNIRQLYLEVKTINPEF